MGVGSSKLQNTEVNNELAQVSFDQASVQSQPELSSKAMLDGTIHANKRPRDRESGDGNSNKKLKRSDSSNSSLQHDFGPASFQSPFSPQSQQIAPRPKEHNPFTAEVSAQEDVDQADEFHESEPHCDADMPPLSQYHDAVEHLDTLDATPETSDELHDAQDPASSIAETSSYASPVASKYTEIELPRTGGTVSTCASPSQLSQQMESQLSQASQAIVEAAAASRDLENAGLFGWKRASGSVSSPRRRENNRSFL